jgi:hypothetical protein
MAWRRFRWLIAQGAINRVGGVRGGIGLAAIPSVEG